MLKISHTISNTKVTKTLPKNESNNSNESFNAVNNSQKHIPLHNSYMNEIMSSKKKKVFQKMIIHPSYILKEIWNKISKRENELKESFIKNLNYKDVL